MMMKKLARVCCFLLIVVMGIGLFPAVPLAAGRPAAAAHEMRGVWVTSAYNLDWPSRRGQSAAEIRTEIDTILNRVVALGMNAVFVQVRPTADSLFPSEIFPWGVHFTGVAGQVPAFYANEGFDPLAYWIEQGHARGVEVHAWLNPFRVSHRAQGITDAAQLPANHPVRLDPTLAISYANGLFLDPGNPAARQLIIDGIEEILINYPTIDGIHFDDYFYPSRYFPDAATFARYGQGYTDIHDWRRSNVNALIRDVQIAVRNINPDVSWGVSPTAIWMNDNTDPRGSQTRGMESYHRLYADTRRWVVEGWVDYIAPQIYWIQGFNIACYNLVLQWWEDVVRGTDVRLYVGMAPYREDLRYTDPRFSNWTEGEMVRQLQRNSQSDVVNGAIFFRHSFLRGEVGDSIGAFFARTLGGGDEVPVPTPTPAPPVIPTHSVGHDRVATRLDVAQPPRNRSIVDAANFNFFGQALPDLPLYVNGIPITNRTPEGFFNIFLPLVRGQNTFTFTQPGQPTVTRVITNNAPTVTQLPRMDDNPRISVAWPARDEWAQHGATITLRATAPAGATVTARVGDVTVPMTQVNANLASTGTRIYAAQFTGQFTLNTAAAATAITDLGRVTYTATFRQQTFTAVSGGRIHQLGTSVPLFGEVISPAPWAFPNATTTGGSAWTFLQGQTDRITAITHVATLISGNWVDVEWTRFASGLWTQSEHVRRWNAPPEQLAEWFSPLLSPADFPPAVILSEGRYIIGELEDRIVWNAPVFPAMTAEFDGTTLIVTLGMQEIPPPIFLPANGETFFSAITTGTHRGAPAYFMTLREGARLEGFYVEYQDGEVHLVLRRRRPLTPGNFPLDGFTFVLDAGHGGTDPGAVGMLYGLYAEKHIVMDVTWKLAERLRLLGATVHLVRDGDYHVPLVNRTDLSRETKPDMFISIHSNSTAETTNATNIHGFTMWYQNANARPAAQAFMSHLRFINPLSNRAYRLNHATFFVCRPVWTPSILVELSFTNNIHDFAWMVCPRRQVDMAWGMVNAILIYYRD